MFTLVFVKRLLLSILYLFKKKDGNVIIISSYNNNSYNFNSRIFFEYLIQAKKNERVFFIIADENKRKTLNEKYGQYFISFSEWQDLKLIYSAKHWLFSTKSFCFIPFSVFGRNLVNLWHGVPLKSIAINDKFQSKFKKAIYKYYYCHFNKYLAVQVPKLSEVYSSSFNVPSSRHIYTGCLVNEMFDKSIDRETNQLVEERVNGTFNILYAPTYRDGGKTDYFPLSDFDFDKLVNFLKAHNAKIFIRPHHLDKGYEQFLESDAISLLDSATVEEISFYFKHFDALITDYSSIMFDYLMVGDETVFFPYDKKEYQQSRGFNYNYDDVVTGPEIASYEEFEAYLTSVFSKSRHSSELEKSLFGTSFVEARNINGCSKLYEYLASKK
ncbi:CDP-glycerol glycerophosphotransferase family protein [Pseudoalteromonas luteoviolacea]|uniref:CDP-glycerol glycerophosphotransferase family protein n=1 Tax=Pseudoalteromonas luteoviolacea TaxID=43657 RepID=UPI00114E38A1|nr:CDP-glycerol glycerophosphotransferase family protein [Pseudoalteromonas luteoviolacea]TQF72212.1 hypothetical protein FLM44_14615 [Pseudoalteromonas luteoviolacea]